VGLSRVDAAVWGDVVWQDVPTENSEWSSDSRSRSRTSMERDWIQRPGTAEVSLATAAALLAVSDPVGPNVPSLRSVRRALEYGMRYPMDRPD
jgi:hypothetical protein